MTMRERQRAVQLYRGQVPSPGRPTVAWRQDRVQFWVAIGRGARSEDAAAEIGLSSAVGTRWFRHAGGVNPCLPPTVSGRYLSFAEREDIAVWHAPARCGPEARCRSPPCGLGMDNAAVHATFLAASLDRLLASRDSEGDAIGRYHQRRDERALAAFRETRDLGRDLNAVRADRDTPARN